MPRLMGNKVMYSVKAVDAHFWIATLGIVLYIASMWIAGVMQGLMWRAFNDDGTLTYTFIETIAATKPYYVIRLLGGLLFLSGMFIMAWNTYKTLTQGEAPEFKAAEPAIWGEQA
jgi:cytochrome c oxidase cbb3-type subunit 1